MILKRKEKARPIKEKARPIKVNKKTYLDANGNPFPENVLQDAKEHFDSAFYLSEYPDVRDAKIEPFHHYMKFGWKEGRDPSSSFSTFQYRQNHMESGSKENPFLHWALNGTLDETKSSSQKQTSNISFNPEYYQSQFQEKLPSDLLDHYLKIGWKQGKDPSPEFSVEGYLDSYPDIKKSGKEPFTHYLNTGIFEGRSVISVKEFKDENSWKGIYKAQAYATSKGPFYEEKLENRFKALEPSVDVLVNYLPQFHTIDENDKFWGKGFTEWRNTSRAMPRFNGHLQPKIPSDFGYYDLSDENVMVAHAEAAKKAGITAFNFYYYWFDGKRVLENPLNNFLDNKDIDSGFSLIWANENWTRT